MEELPARRAAGTNDDHAPAPLALLPGLLCDREIWKRQIERFEPGREVVVPDLTGATTVAALATSTLAQLPPRFDLVGFSMGGYVAMQVAFAAPERVASLALVDTTARPDLPAASERRRELVKLAYRQGVAAAAREMVPALIAEHRRQDPAVVGPWVAMAERIGVEDFGNQQAAIIARPDARSGLREIDCPALVVYGELDVIAPPEDQEEMARLIPGAGLQVIPDCGHLSLLEEPERVDEILTEWLGARDGKPTPRPEAGVASDSKEE